MAGDSNVPSLGGAVSRTQLTSLLREQFLPQPPAPRGKTTKTLPDGPRLLGAGCKAGHSLRPAAEYLIFLVSHLLLATGFRQHPAVAIGKCQIAGSELAQGTARKELPSQAWKAEAHPPHGPT